MLVIRFAADYLINAFGVNGGRRDSVSLLITFGANSGVVTGRGR